MKLEELRSRVEAGEIDTVLIALCDMQGRLQGKRLTARHFVDEVVEHSAEGCNYLLAVDVEALEHRRRLRDVVLGAGLRRFWCYKTQPGHPAPGPVAGGYGDDPLRSGLGERLRRRPPRRADHLRRQLGAAGRARVDLRQHRHRVQVHGLPRDLRVGVAQGLSQPRSGQPLQRRLLDAGDRAGGAADSPDPQRHGGRRDGGGELKGECNYGQHEIDFHYSDALRTANDHPICPDTTRRSPPGRGWRSATWPSSTSARAARATSTSRWPTATNTTPCPATVRCSSPSWPASWLRACAS